MRKLDRCLKAAEKLQWSHEVGFSRQEDALLIVPVAARSHVSIKVKELPKLIAWLEDMLTEEDVKND